MVPKPAVETGRAHQPDQFGFYTPTKFEHHPYKEMDKWLKFYASKCPNITRLYSIGSSVQGRQLYVVEISDNPGQHELGKTN